MSDEEKDVFSGSVTSQPQMVNVQTSGPMYIVERSSAPQVIGILVIVYYILTTLMSLLSWLSLDFISDIDDSGVEALPTGLLLGVIFLSLIPAVIGIFGGFRIFQYKKQGIWITLGAIVTAWLISIVNTALTSDYSGGTGDAGLDAMFQGVCGIFCVAICGIIVCIPLFMANSGLE
jgi:hypothetical protein|tara:strand:+ start:13133 stop:13660 length:528 start_codon:yes stop_codon:yes gene_type:complete